MTKLYTRIPMLAVLVLLAVPSMGIAASSEEGYGGPNNVVSGVQGGQNEGDPGQTAPTAETATQNVASVASTSDESGSLPFTGADLAILAAAGLVLLGFGYGLRVLTRQPSQP